jgi:1A family penicillin-binding protein
MQRMRRRDWFIILPVLAFVGFAYGTSAFWFSRYALAIHRLTRGVGDTVFYTADGRPWFAMDEQRRDVSLTDISKHLRNAVVAVEDHRFRSHVGIDPIGFERAIFENIKARGVAEGGSTITQQLARTLFLSNSRTFARKFQEALLAMMLERRLSKDQILELYLNRVYLGAGVNGVGKMSRYLFGKPPAQLTLAESALIAGLIQRPSALSPWSNMSGARERSYVVLARMRDERYITESEEQAARTARIAIRPYPKSDRADAGYAKEYLRQEFRQIFGGDEPPDWKAQTTFLPRFQDEAERAVGNGLRRLGRRNLQAAMVVIRPENGEVVALVGGSDFAQTEFDRATRSRRQPGSAFKPFLYAAALERGFSPISMLLQPEEVPVEGQGDWRPRNVNNAATRDELPLREAFIESNNRAAVGVQQYLGARPVLALASSLGMKDLPNVPSLALGTGLVSPLQLTSAYAVFVNGGFAVQPHGLRYVRDAHGLSAWDATPTPRRVLSKETAFQMVSLLNDVIERGTATGAKSRGVFFPAGGKTGTTNDYRDAWFVGFSSSLAAGVWVGFDDSEPMGPNASGANYALPIWSEFMSRTARLAPPHEFAPPATLRQQVLCSVSYKRATNSCPTYVEYFKEGDDIPSDVCKLHRGPTVAERARMALKRWWEKVGDIFRW